MNRTPEETKKLVAGPLGRQMEMFPLRFCKPAYFGVPPSREHPVVVNNGTASLLDLRGDLLAVTCHHVIEGYRRKLDEDSLAAATWVRSCAVMTLGCGSPVPL